MFRKAFSVGQRIIYADQKGYEDLWRKHQTSSFAHDIWMYETRTGDHTKLTTYPAEELLPTSRNLQASSSEMTPAAASRTAFSNREASPRRSRIRWRCSAGARS